MILNNTFRAQRGGFKNTILLPIQWSSLNWPKKLSPKYLMWDQLMKIGWLTSNVTTDRFPAIKASPGYGMIQMFFKESKCLIWVTTHKVSSEFPQGYAVTFVFLSQLLNCRRYWHATFITNFTRSVERDGLGKMSDLSDNPQRLLWISSGFFRDFCVYYYLLNIERFWHETIHRIS